MTIRSGKRRTPAPSMTWKGKFCWRGVDQWRPTGSTPESEPYPDGYLLPANAQDTVRGPSSVAGLGLGHWDKVPPALFLHGDAGL